MLVVETKATGAEILARSMVMLGFLTLWLRAGVEAGAEGPSLEGRLMRLVKLRAIDMVGGLIRTRFTFNQIDGRERPGRLGIRPGDPFAASQKLGRFYDKACAGRWSRVNWRTGWTVTGRRVLVGVMQQNT